MGRRHLGNRDTPQRMGGGILRQGGGETTHHLSVLHGDDMEAVQRMLMHELRSTYTEASEIEVTVLRMEEIETEPNVAMFNGTFTP